MHRGFPHFFPTWDALHMAKIDTVDARSRLKPQDEPYWARLAAGCYIGYRKLTSASVGTWVGRYRDGDTGSRLKRSFGELDHLPASQRYDAAKRQAEEWFKHLGMGGSSEVVTVRRACERYVDHVREAKGDKPADDVDARFKRWVYQHKELADAELAKLSRPRIEKWRQALAKTPVKVNRDSRDIPVTRPRSASSVNRDVTALRAALNHAHDGGHVTSDTAWRVALRPAKNAGGRRDVYLDLAQRKKLIENSPLTLGTFLRGLSLVPLRPGALASLTVANIDVRLGVLTIGKDKAGQDRRIKLPATTAAFFAKQAAQKRSSAVLFTRADGKAWDKDAWKGPMKAAASAAGLPATTTAYALRHSTITDLVTGGLDLLTVAQLSGTSVAMIEKHYGHLQSDRAAKALALLTV